MLDFKELPKDGDAFELLIRELLLVKGFHVHWSGKGPDGGRDMICYEDRPSEFQADRKTWLIQCKHNAHGGGSVGVGDLDDIISSCGQHGADAYLLVCSTVPSSGVVNRLEGITNNPTVRITAAYWDATIIEQKLSTPILWRVAQLFFPVSSRNSTWEVYATERPNEWITNYRGYHFHLSNRIGSTDPGHFSSIDARINDIEKIDAQLGEGHFIRIRSVNFDDKNGGYNWDLDYMFPSNEPPRVSSAWVAKALGHGWCLEDGQSYSFDVIVRPYHPYSDHYDKDHYDYYTPYLHGSRQGVPRKRTREEAAKQYADLASIIKQEEQDAVAGFDRFKLALESVPFIRIFRAVNSGVEHIDKFVYNRDWEDIVNGYKIDINHLFSSWFLLDVGAHEQEFIDLVSQFRIDVVRSFRLNRVYLFTPNDEGKATLEADENSMFELTIYADQSLVHTAATVRSSLNEYFEECAKAVEQFKTANSHLFP
ncbi:restriction endonuclease [Hymenobacter convexus]|uniref:restriction endonuclease n=1 Tax=Hymenobacter sp. CA1UV-4 TaxID=3063782 RepID=UPI0027138B25|nr:restriction endonuclease [Hymenobacter sp. CA1UV-4]MDO7853189.1 restriction endonuclease [Hymenobacter sp. CA1UV-4]